MTALPQSLVELDDINNNMLNKDTRMCTRSKELTHTINITFTLSFVVKSVCRQLVSVFCLVMLKNIHQFMTLFRPAPVTGDNLEKKR